MADLREQILARLVTVCAGVTGIVSAARNKLDVPLMSRPAVVIFGGAELVLSPAPTLRARTVPVMLMDLTPQIILLVRNDNDTESGPLMSLFRGRLVAAITGDATLLSLVTSNGFVRYEGCTEAEPTPESKEPRLEINVLFRYPLRLSDLAA